MYLNLCLRLYYEDVEWQLTQIRFFRHSWHFLNSKLKILLALQRQHRLLSMTGSSGGDGSVGPSEGEGGWDAESKHTEVSTSPSSCWIASRSSIAPPRLPDACLAVVAAISTWWAG